MTKVKMDKAQSLTTTRTATYHLRTISDEEIDTTMIEEEDWIEYRKRSTDEAMEKMENAKIRCWNKTHKRMKWRLALRIATSPSERWLMKAAEWNPELSSKYRTNRAIGRPGKRWEDDINEFLKHEEDETENLIESSSQINKTWINTAKDRGRWTLLEDKNTMTADQNEMKIMRECEEILRADK